MRWTVLILFCLEFQAFAQTLPCDVGPKVVGAYSVVSNNTISIVWPTNYLRTELHVARRVYTNRPSAWETWTLLYSNSNPATVTAAGQYTDSNVTNGISYEYQVSALVTNWDCGGGSVITPWSAFWAYQYINTGTNVPVRDARGNLVLLVESSLATPLGAELTTLTNDLIGDGYKVFRHDIVAVDVTNTGWFNAVTNTKALIKSDWVLDSNADWTIFIVGHVPIPYSGQNSPGSHADNTGAHPADWYYADMDESNWTDTTVSNQTAAFTSMWNIVGDGKFDQSTLPDAPEMRVGRVDLTNMPAFGLTQVQLLQRYLLRDHQWRTKQFTVRNKAIIQITALPYEANSQFASLFGTTTNEVLGGWLTNATNLATSYLIAAQKGAGEYDEAIGLGYTTNFAAVSLYVPFTTMYGSYYGDWDSGIHSNDVAQAPLCQAGYPLTMTYRENTLNMDSSAMGEPIGQETYAMAANFFPSFGNRYIQYGYIFSGTTYSTTENVNNYVSLMGDPTLRLYQVSPPTNVSIQIDGADKLVYWTDASDTGIQGYHVYRAYTTNKNNFTRLTTVATNMPYRDVGAGPSNYTYMIRTVKLQSTVNRSFYDASEGVLSGGLEHTNYYVATNGSDSNLGTSASPFLTVQKGVNVAYPGDRVILGPGVYGETVFTARNGSNGAPITVDGQGVAQLWSVGVLHEYLTMQNLTIAGKPIGWWIYLSKAANHCVISNNVIDGEWNTNLYQLLKWDNPSGADLPLGTNCASYCLVISNTFKRAISEGSGVQMFGAYNTFYGNTCRDYDAADWLYLWGVSNRIANNLFTNLFILNGSGHPDCIQTFGINGIGASGLLVENNTFIDCPGDVQICMFEGQDCPSCYTNYTIRNNLFVRIGSKGTMVLPSVNWLNNTFIECATNSASAAYVLIFASETNGITCTNFWDSSGNDCHVLNNVFYNCGDGITNKNYYDFYTNMVGVQADYNFGCYTNGLPVIVDPLHRAVGDPGGWAGGASTAWWEPHGINGGNPNLGADYRPLTNSFLIGAATNLNALFTMDHDAKVRGSYWDIGAFQYASGSNPSPPSGGALGILNVSGSATIGTLRSAQ